MPTRRQFLLGTVMAGALFAAGPRAWAQVAASTGASTGGATSFILNLGSQFVGIIDAPSSIEQKRTQLQPLIENAVDVEGIARFCLGRFWRTASPPQQQEFVRLFHAVLMNNIFGKLGELKGVTFQPTTTTQAESDTLVGTVIKRPNQQANNVQWVVDTVNGQYKIVDLRAEGVSLRLTQRNDYAAYMQRNGNNVDALLSAVRQQVAR